MATLSILLLCWNHARYLDQCVAALAAQTSRDVEILFLDNASTDGSADLAETLLAGTGLAHRIIRNSKPAGIADNFNTLLAQASGELVAPLSTDDWYEPDYAEKIIEAGKEATDAAMFAVNGWSEYELEGTSVPSSIPGHGPQDIGVRYLEDRDALFWVGLCYRRSVLEGLGGWDEDQIIEDMDLIFRLTRDHKVVQLGDRLVHYRRSSQSVSLDPHFMTRGRLGFFAKHRRHFAKGYRRRIAELLRSGAAVCLDQGRKREAAAFLLRALALRPLDGTNWRTAGYLLRSMVRAK